MQTKTQRGLSLNYRVIKVPISTEEGGGFFYGFHEVYYSISDGTVDSWAEMESTPGSETPEGLQAQWKRYLEALNKPVLVVEGDKVVGEEPAINQPLA